MNEACYPEKEIAQTMNCMNDTAKVMQIGIDGYNQSLTGDVAFTIKREDEQPAVADVYGINVNSSFAMGGDITKEVSGVLTVCHRNGVFHK